MNQTSVRLHFLDYARALFIFFVVFDHTIHAYCASFGKFWFVLDPDRDVFWDVVHLICYAVMIPGLFFLAGIFTPDSLSRHGWWHYTRDRVIKLLVPMGIGVVTVSPILEYIRGVHKDGMSADFWTYYTTVYFQKNFALTGFWFLGFLFVLTMTYLILVLVLPALQGWLRALGEACMKYTRATFWGIGLLLALSFMLLTMRHGTFYWIGYRYFFTAIASFIGAYVILFVLGLALGAAQAHKNEAFLVKLSQSFRGILLTTIIVTLIYLFVAVGYIDDGAYSDALPYLFYKGGSWSQALSLFYDERVMIFRAFMHGWVTWGLLLTTVVGFYKYLNRPISLLQTLAANSFVIYLIHEPFVLWQHVFFMNTATPLIFRVLFITLASLWVSWLISEKWLRRSRMIRRVVG